MSSELNPEAARNAFFASFPADHQQVAEELLSVMDDMVLNHELKSGSIDQLIELDHQMSASQADGHEPSSDLPQNLNVGHTRAIIAYLALAYGIVISAAEEFDLENTDHTLLLIEAVKSEADTGEPDEPTPVPPPIPSEADDEADFDPGALSAVNSVPLLPDLTEAGEPPPMRSAPMDNWPSVRESLKVLIEQIRDLQNVQKSIQLSLSPKSEFEAVEEKIVLLYAHLAERARYLQRMAGRRHRFQALYQKALKYIEDSTPPGWLAS
ncbi:hypothetical protein KJ611_01565 [Patescibacteria group bacterium]|nr:hypothetical protein [Patescibacteria group bacterium]MBU1705340.1 hypothetical protein [Patescibacteria group bacterium]